ncbi:MAG: hypothetical protein ACE3L7_22265 [Candidatus Pristimantibacillus sp.]
MSIRPIQRTERAIQLAPVQAVSPYTSYPYREGEPQLPPERNFNWNSTYRQAAASAAEWLMQCRQALTKSTQIARRLRHNFSESNLIEQLQELTATINHLQQSYNELSAYIKPDQWRTILQSMKHPAAEKLGLIWDTTGTLTFEEVEASSAFQQQPSSEQTLFREILGRSGLLTLLQRALSTPTEIRAIDVLRPDITVLQPYTAYYNSMQTYWPFPSNGYLLNQLI